MTNESQCPDASQLQALLNAALSEEEQESLADHLTVCQSCRQRFDEMSACLDVLAQATRQKIRRRDQPDEALRDMMNKLRAERPDDAGPGQGTGDLTRGPSVTTSDLSLDFLGPPENPAHLGRLGPYEITEVVGRGGMGVVLKGFDRALTRHVAIKVLSPQLASNGAARKRFLREARAAAAVSHDHVVTIHAVDETAHLPYLVMEYVAGRSLENRIKQTGPLKLEEILRIGMQAAAGLAAAHAQGLVHRDIKPSNILLENGVERVKLTDFGLAKAADDARITQTGVVTGTPEYMSPEQARGEPVDQRSDLFSLGCVLYAMCTGRSPFRASTVVDAIRRVCDDTPRAISEINRDIPNWLAAIIDRLLAKDPDDRFQTVLEVSELLGGHLAHLQQPTVVPRPPSVKSVSRKPAPAARSRRQLAPWLIAAACVVLIGVLVQGMNKGVVGVRTSGPGVVPGPIVNPHNEAEAVPESGKLILNMYKSQAYPAVYRVVVRQGDSEHVFDTEGRHELQLAAGKCNIDVYHWKTGELMRSGTAAISGRGPRVINIPVYYQSQTAMRPQPTYLAEYTTGTAGPSATSLSPDGLMLATPGPKGIVVLWERRGELWAQTAELRGHEGSIGRIVFSPNSRLIASKGNDNTVRLWNVDACSEQFALPGQVNDMAFTADSTLLATTSDEHAVVVWSTETGKQLAVLEPDRDSTASSTDKFELLAASRCIACAPDGATVATGHKDGQVILWDLASRRLRAVLHGHTSWVGSLAFSRKGHLLASAGGDKTIRIWDVGSAVARHTLGCHQHEIRTVGFSPDGEVLISGGSDGEIRTWGLEQGRLIREFHADWGPIKSAVVLPDGKQLVTAAGCGSIRFWDLASLLSESRDDLPEAVTNASALSLNATIPTVEAPLHVRFSQDGKAVAIGQRLGTIDIWNLSTLERIVEIPGLEAPSSQMSFEFTADGTSLVCSRGKSVEWWNTKTGVNERVLSHRLPAGTMTISRTGQHLASVVGGKRLFIWDANTEDDAPRRILKYHDESLSAVHFSPDEKLVAVGTGNGLVLLWDFASDSPNPTVLKCGLTWVTCIRFLPDAKTLVCSSGNEVKVWDTHNNKEIGEALEHEATVTSLALSADGKILAASVGSHYVGGVVLWDLAGRRQVASWRTTLGGTKGVDLSVDGRLVTIGEPRDTRLWKCKLGLVEPMSAAAR